jgi:hypothetical protein
MLALATVVIAAVPQTISYQGRLTSSSGDPLDTTVSITFTIYDDSTLGNSKWTETHPSVTVTDGLFNVILGAGIPAVPIHDSVFNQPDRYLGIQVGSDPELAPRTRLVSVGYSHRVSTVDGSTGGIISGDIDIQSDLTVSGKATIDRDTRTPDPMPLSQARTTPPAAGRALSAAGTTTLLMASTAPSLVEI